MLLSSVSFIALKIPVPEESKAKFTPREDSTHFFTTTLKLTS